MDFSSNEAINKIHHTDANVEVRAYVDAVQGTETVGKKNLKLFKFVINNGNGKRIQCLAWEDEVDRVADIVEMNKILHIEGARAKQILNQRFNMGNAPFELSITKITEIKELGVRQREVNQRERESAKLVICWEELPDMIEEEIIVSGFIKFNIKEIKHINNESTQGIGCITDGKLKLELRLTTLAGLPQNLKKGLAVQVIGIVKSGSYLYLKVNSGADIIPIDEPAMNVDAMLNITSPPAKKLKLDV